MTLSKRTRIVAGLLLAGVLAACVVGAARVIHRQVETEEYAAAPFKPVGKDFPRLLPLAEKPASRDKEASQRYQEERRAVHRALKEHGAFQRATADEQKALEADRNSHYVEARELAEKILEDHPESVPALYVLAGAFAEAEGNLPQALFRIRAMRHLVEARGRQDPEDADAREWYLRGLQREYEVLGLMDRRAEELRTIELLEQVYGEELPWLKVFPLIKLQRIEAREFLERTARTGRWPLKTLNGRILIESQLHRRADAYRVGKECVADPAATAVIWKNFSGCCSADFRPEEAEAALRKCLKLPRDFVRTPYLVLSSLELNQGRLAPAWDALNRADGDRKRRDQSTFEQDQAEMAAAIAELMLVIGNAAEAEARARQGWERPSRHGSSTEQQDHAALASGVLFRATLLSRLEELREADAATGAGSFLLSRRQESLQLEAWAVKRSLLRLLGNETFLNQSLRPYLPDSPGTETWLVGSLLEVLPSGVAVEALRQARAAEEHPRAVPYFDAFEAELLLRQGQPDRARQLARQSLEQLSATEKLLRGRIAAVAAEAARQQGDADACRMLWSQALADFPAAGRLLRLAVPVQVEDDGSPLARQLAGQLLRSPRFRAEPDGLQVVLRGNGGQLGFEMFRDGGRRHFADSVPANGSETEVVASALKLFHERLLSPEFRLTQLQINRLGNPASGARASENADNLMKRVKGS